MQIFRMKTHALCHIIFLNIIFRNYISKPNKVWKIKSLFQFECSRYEVGHVNHRSWPCEYLTQCYAARWWHRYTLVWQRHFIRKQRNESKSNMLVNRQLFTVLQVSWSYGDTYHNVSTYWLIKISFHICL